MKTASNSFASWRAAALAFAALLAPAAHTAGWDDCTRIANDAARLQCFDSWARSQAAPASPAATPVPATTPGSAVAAAPAPKPPADPQDLCHRTGYSALSRFWELEHETSCDVFGIRGYRPISLSLIRGNTVNGQPTSGNPLNNAPSSLDYRTVETRVQLSVRTKLAQGLLTGADGPRDSLWFAYTQQSYWQVFTPSLSRPFRSTDHEPEFVYVYPATAPLPGNWTLRYAGLGVVHQSNGQSLPLSRSWNRMYLMAGAEQKGGFTLAARLWQRIPEKAADDDNPDISDTVGRMELAANWDATPLNTFGVTWRNSLRSVGKGSVRLEWMRKVESRTPSPLGTLRTHVQLFRGYGDSLLDFNRRRTVLGVGLSLVDW